MWPKEYRDYPIDEHLVKEQVEAGKGIVGCEMHEINGYGLTHHKEKGKKKKSLLVVLASLFFGKSKANDGT